MYQPTITKKSSLYRETSIQEKVSTYRDTQVEFSSTSRRTPRRTRCSSRKKSIFPSEEPGMVISMTRDYSDRDLRSLTLPSHGCSSGKHVVVHSSLLTYYLKIVERQMVIMEVILENTCGRKS